MGPRVEGGVPWADDVARRLEPLRVEEAERLTGRLSARLALPRGEAVVSTVFGIAHFAPAFEAERKMEAIREVVLAHLGPDPVDSFRIRASRADKSFPLLSPAFERELGTAVQEPIGRFSSTAQRWRSGRSGFTTGREEGGPPHRRRALFILPLHERWRRTCSSL